MTKIHEYLGSVRNRISIHSLITVLAIGMIGSTCEAQRICTCFESDPQYQTVSSGSTTTMPCMAGARKYIWTDRKVLRIKFMDGSPIVQERVKNAAMEWTQHADIKFDFGNDPNAEIRIAFPNDGFSKSRLGNSALNVPKNQPTMFFGWFDESTSLDEIRRTTLHEFGHALGLIHEHLSPTSNFIQWNKSAVYADFASRNPPWRKAQVDANLFARMSATETNYSQFDKFSIMTYRIPSHWTLDSYSVPGASALSEIDKRYIGEIYGAPKGPKRIKLTSLQCGIRQEATGRDEVHIRVLVDGQLANVQLAHPKKTTFTKIPISRMDSGDTWQLNTDYEFKNTLDVEIWEVDNPKVGDNHDLIGRTTITKAGPGSQVHQAAAGEFKEREHRYTLTWQ